MWSTSSKAEAVSPPVFFAHYPLPLLVSSPQPITHAPTVCVPLAKVNAATAVAATAAVAALATLSDGVDLFDDD